MIRSGITDLRLHGGHAPHWLLTRMIKLSSAILKIIHEEFGSEEILQRLANPLWFQALSCVTGMDWNSSGTTTVLCGVLKSVLNTEYGVLEAGGKGKRSLKTSEDLNEISKKFDFSEEFLSKLQYFSKIVAKVDNSVVQDGYNLYIHTFFVNEKGNWTIVQQGLNSDNRMSRRYHWYSNNVTDFINEPEEEILSQIKHQNVLDLTYRQNEEIRQTTLDLIKEKPQKTLNLFNSIQLRSKLGQTTLSAYFEAGQMLPKFKYYYKLMPRRIKWKVLKKLYEFQPRNYEEFVATKGVGPGMIRGLSFVSSVIFDKEIKFRDPVKYALAFGGKDGEPYPIDRREMDNSINYLESVILDLKLKKKEKLTALKGLKRFSSYFLET
ncbi:MAG: DUF763 domain-containing protein [Candidatus Helarchaeota archaeon]|nr:DUF763 domain-containing protein [Candidatus Helarchaeota archaeon]